MNYLAAYANPHIAKRLLEVVRSFTREVRIMEVCGTHTVELFRTGIRQGLPDNIDLVSGPGCPVCVTPTGMMEKAIGLACRGDVVLFCFGDMMKVPGRTDNLEAARADRGANVRVMYGPLDALDFARAHPASKVVLFGVGFETTAPLFASVLMRARAEGVRNLYLLPAFKVIPPALEALLSSDDIGVDGFLLPGHVSAVIGSGAYAFMIEKYGVPGVITGFESVDMLEGIFNLVNMICLGRPSIMTQYTRFVTEEGNRVARAAVSEVFTEADATWRGIGTIPCSGLALREAYRVFDAESLVDFDVVDAAEPRGCRCGEVIKGLCKPTACPLFKQICNPTNPVGPCMVSSEGTCAAYFKYGQYR